MREKTTNQLVGALAVAFVLCLVGMTVGVVGFVYTSDSLVSVGEVLTAPLTVILGLADAGGHHQRCMLSPPLGVRAAVAATRAHWILLVQQAASARRASTGIPSCPGGGDGAARR